MSRATDLLQRLRHMGHISVDEQTREDDEMSDDDASATSPSENDRMSGEEDGGTEDTSPFSKDIRNPDGSMKIDQTDQPINDRRRFIQQRRR